MNVKAGSSFLLKIFDPQTNKFEVIGGLYTTKFNLKNNFSESKSVKASSWREIHSIQQSYLSINATGIFTSTKSERMIAKYAFSGEIIKYQLCFGNSNTIMGNFLVSGYERNGDIDDIEAYSISLESSGKLELI